MERVVRRTTRRCGPPARSPADMAAQYRAGASLDTLAHTNGVCRSCVRKVLAGQGVVLRPSGWPPRQARP